MADTNKRDWIDVAAKLLIPIVLAVGGYLFTAHKDKIDAEQQQLERDSGYIKLLVSDNDKERDLGLRIISVLQKEGRFSRTWFRSFRQSRRVVPAIPRPRKPPSF